MSSDRHVIIGAGPAGLTAAWQLAHLGERPRVLESDPTCVGGLARTVEYKGNRFDIGGHRFHSSSETINRLWQQMLPHEFLRVPRLSRIYHRGTFLRYPISAPETFRHLGLLRAAGVTASYLRARLLPRKPERSVEDWLVNRFGRELYRTLFESYTEKVCGMPASAISADWAAQRIRGLSLTSAVRDALFPSRDGDETKTLLKSFLYPRLGPGQLWSAVADQIVYCGGRMEMGETVVKMNRRGDRAVSVETRDGRVHSAEHFLSTMPLGHLVQALDPPPPADILRAGSSLRQRDILVVALLVDRGDLFPDSWIYVHDRGVRVGRIQNYKNWSEAMVADPARTCLGMEYFCDRGDDVWRMQDRDLIRLAARELERIGLAREADCRDGCVTRMRDAYPLYGLGYERHRQALRGWIAENLGNVHPLGRGGLHSYASMDQAMMTAVLTVRNLTDGTAFDVWSADTAVGDAAIGDATIGDVTIGDAAVGRASTGPAPERPAPARRAADGPHDDAASE